MCFLPPEFMNGRSEFMNTRFELTSEKLRNQGSDKTIVREDYFSRFSKSPDQIHEYILQ